MVACGRYPSHLSVLLLPLVSAPVLPFALRTPHPASCRVVFPSCRFGIDASDNLNLLQPVNPWMGNEWLIYNEYYQWQPSYK